MSAGNEQGPSELREQASPSAQAAGEEAEDAGTSSRLMQRMLEATLLDQRRELTGEEWLALRQIAADGQSLGWGMTELVERIIKQFLTLRFVNLQQDEATTDSMCHRIAVTLASDPYARQRLNEFQQHLLRSSK